MTNELPTLELFQAGQSPWLDNISRDLLRSGALKNMIETQGLKGVTSNPAIFQKAISSSGNAKTPSYYEADIRKFLGQGMSTIDIYDGLTIADIRDTCDLFLPIYTETSGEHGFVSLEVLPNLAYDKETTLSEARRLFRTVDRPNLLIKVPATNEGVAAVETLISEGVSVNITLMFSLKHYQDVAEAYVKGLEVFSKKGGDLSKVHSVASVFVSRVDSYVDAQLDELIQAARDLEKKSFFDNLKGKSAVANSKIIYQEFKKIFYSQRFKKLQAEGAHIQKVLWGSTSVKNSTYPDLLYVDTLVGENTVNTMPQVTFDALLDHGDIEVNTVEEALPEARDLIRDLKTLGIDLEKVGDELQVQGVESFVVAFDLLMKSLEEHYEKKQKRLPLAKIKCSLPDKTTEKTVIKNLSKLKSDNFLSRFFNLDPAVWKREAVHQSVIANRMGWLHVHDWILG